LKTGRFLQHEFAGLLEKSDQEYLKRRIKERRVRNQRERVGDARTRTIHNFSTTENIFLLRAPHPHTPDVDDLRLQVLCSLSLDWMQISGIGRFFAPRDFIGGIISPGTGLVQRFVLPQVGE
jgi:hypothetical protein